MKIFFIFFIFFIFSKDLYSNQNLVGKWEVKNVPDNCEMKYESSSTHRGSGIDGKFLQIKKDRSIEFIVRSRTSERYEYIFIGKINPSWKKIGMNDNWGDFNITGKVKNNKIFAKLNALNEQHKDYYKRKAKNCTFEFHKIDIVQKDSSKNQASENLENEELIQRNITKTKQFLREEGFAKSEILRLEEMINSDYLFANLISSKICLQRNGMITFVSNKGGCGFGEEINLDQIKKIFRNDNDITNKNNDKRFKWQSSENPNETVFNEDYNNAKITCTDKDGNVYSRDKSIYKTCDELFEKISGIVNNEFKETRICIRKNGEFYFIPLEAGCGFNKELSKEIYQVLIDENSDNSETNDLYLSIDAILGEWEGMGRYQSDEYPVYLIFDLNSRGELIGRYNYGTKNNHEKGGNLFLLKDDRNKNWKEILKLQRRFAMEWNEGDDKGWFSFEVKGNEQILGFWGYNMKTRADFGGSYSIAKISNNIPKLGDSENSNTIEPISRPNF